MMSCTVVYGAGKNLKHKENMSVKEAFSRLPSLRMGWIFVDIYYAGKLVYTTQGAAGVRYCCDDCPYCKTL